MSGKVVCLSTDSYQKILKTEFFDVPKRRVPAVEEYQLADIQGRVARRGGLVNVHQPTNQGQTSALVTVASRTPRNTHCIHSHGHYHQCQPYIYSPPAPAQTLTVRTIMKRQMMSGSLPTPVWGLSPEASLHICKVERWRGLCLRLYRCLSKTFLYRGKSAHLRGLGLLG